MGFKGRKGHAKQQTKGGEKSRKALGLGVT